jgi:hypothetical protein
VGIDRIDMEKALEFLASSDVDFARAKTLNDGLYQQRQTIKAHCFIRSGEKSAASREQVAYQMPDYIMHLQKMETANLEYLTLSAQRSTAAIVIDCWRSLNATRNKGNVV